ncbi:unnamed protein product [Bemisia tabaci]|uniref:Uncharacterized protein n=1 Tax=Bemisia tabaci TaxID=7038 RepID=A0A9P0F2J2_BEMTA|nr:unnamed protein product [Bemisia tabaci]
MGKLLLLMALTVAELAFLANVSGTPVLGSSWLPNWGNSKQRGAPPKSWSVNIYEKKLAGGKNQTLSGPGCQNVMKELNDKTSSFLVTAGNVQFFSDKDCAKPLGSCSSSQDVMRNDNLKDSTDYNDKISSVGDCPGQAPPNQGKPGGKK